MEMWFLGKEPVMHIPQANILENVQQMYKVKLLQATPAHLGFSVTMVKGRSTKNICQSLRAMLISVREQSTINLIYKVTIHRAERGSARDNINKP